MRHRQVIGRILGTVALAATLVTAGVGTASAAPAALPGPVRAFAAAHHGSLDGSRHGSLGAHRSAALQRRLTVAGVAADAEPMLTVRQGCASGKTKAKPSAYLYSTVKVTLDYRLTGRGVNKKGTVTLKKNKDVTLKLPSVGVGSYDLTLTRHKSSTSVGSQSFDVLPCVQVTTSCHAITFSNPNGNPAAVVDYGLRKSRIPFEIRLAPGASRTVRADDEKTSYAVFGLDADADLGHGTAKVKVKKCAAAPAQPDQNAIQTFAYAGCAPAGTPGATGEVSITWAAQSSLKNATYTLAPAQADVTKTGSVKAQKDVTLDLAPGTYRYRTYANGIATPFEDVGFVVLTCATITPQCKSFDVDNTANTAALDVYAFNNDDDAEADASIEPTILTAPAGQTTNVPWSTGNVIVFAGAAEGTNTSTFYSSALPLDDETDGIAIPQDCS